MYPWVKGLGPRLGVHKFMVDIPWRKGEVDQSDFSGDFWRVVRIGEFSGDVKSERIHTQNCI